MKFSRIGFLSSHRGSSMRAVVSACAAGTIDATPLVVVSNNARSEALVFAKAHGMAAHHISAANSGGDDEADAQIARTLAEHEIDILVLSGYLKPVRHRVLRQFKGRILNIHPSLLPDFGGKGMYGIHVHEAVLRAGRTVSGITIHLVTEEYDAGPIMAQLEVPLDANETPTSLAAKIQEQEPQFFVETLRKISKSV